MHYPFSAEEFMEVFRQYNLSVWPVQILFVVSALFVITRLIRGKKDLKIAGYLLSFYWLWMGLVYHLLFFSSINPAAYVFGILFILQAVLFFFFTYRDRKGFIVSKENRVAGFLLLTYSLLIYPLLGHWSGHSYPYAPTFGLPCPTTIFTFGLLLFYNGRLVFYLVVIPVVWSVIGFFAALSFSVYEDIGLPVAALLFLFFYFRTKQRELES